MDEVVAPFGERVDDRGQAGDADLEPAVEGNVDLGDRGQPAVDVGVGADHLDVEARARRARGSAGSCASRRACRRGRRRRARRGAGRRRSGSASASRGRGTRTPRRTGSRGCTRRTASSAARWGRARPPHPIIATISLYRRRELALVDPASAAVEVRMAELAFLEQLDQVALVDPEVHRNAARRAAARARPAARGRRRAEPWRTLPSRITRSTIFSTAAGSGRRRPVADPSERIASDIAAWVHFAALPWPRGRRRDRRGCGPGTPPASLPAASR